MPDVMTTEERITQALMKVKVTVLKYDSVNYDPKRHEIWGMNSDGVRYALDISVARTALLQLMDEVIGKDELAYGDGMEIQPAYISRNELRAEQRAHLTHKTRGTE